MGPLDEESQILTTFIYNTFWQEYLRAPYSMQAGNWMVKQVKRNVNMEISALKFLNQLQHQIQPKSEEVLDSDKQGTDIEHTIIHRKWTIQHQ